MEVESEKNLEARKKLLLSLSAKNPKIHSSDSSSFFPANFDPKICSSLVKFNGWKCPQKDWKFWVQKMTPLHEPTWRKAGIFEAILNSTCRIWKNDDLVFGVAEKWCGGAKNFIFPWGEASISLEDVKILGGYSVLGSPVSSPIETEEMKEIEEKLKKKMEEIGTNQTEKGRNWIKKFMDCGDSEIEHVAFLALWLSRFVFPSYYNKIEASSIPVAIHLSRGTRIALAAPVLASIYRDLSSLKNIISETRDVQIHGNVKFVNHSITVLCAPLHLVQVWVWERFLLFRPVSKSIGNVESRLRRWDGIKCQFKSVRSILDSSKDSFVWCPYASEEKSKEDDSASTTRAKEKLNISSSPPGFPPKRKMVEEEKGFPPNSKEEGHNGLEVERKQVGIISPFRCSEAVLDSGLVRREFDSRSLVSRGDDAKKEQKCELGVKKELDNSPIPLGFPKRKIVEEDHNGALGVSNVFGLQILGSSNCGLEVERKQVGIISPLPSEAVLDFGLVQKDFASHPLVSRGLSQKGEMVDEDDMTIDQLPASMEGKSSIGDLEVGRKQIGIISPLRASEAVLDFGLVKKEPEDPCVSRGLWQEGKMKEEEPFVNEDDMTIDELLASVERKKLQLAK